MILYFSVEAPYEWALVDRQGEVIGSGISETLQSLPVPDRLNAMVGIVPGSLVTIHRVDLPARSKAKVLAAIPYALEERLATDVDELVFTMLHWNFGQNVTVAVIDKRYIDTVRADFTKLGWEVDALIPEFLLVPLHDQTRLTLARKKNGSFLLRTGECSGMVFDANALQYWWDSLSDTQIPIAVNDAETAQRLIGFGGSAVRHWDIGRTFSDWLTHQHTPFDQINILKDLDTHKHAGRLKRMYRAAAILLCLGLLTKIGIDMYENYLLYRQNREIDREIVEIFQQSFPHVTRIVNPRLQMEQQMRMLQTETVAAGRFQMLLSAVARVVTSDQATLEEITFRENTLLITCTTKDFAGLDRLKQRFAQDKNVQAELLSSGSRDNKVSARFKLQSA